MRYIFLLFSIISFGQQLQQVDFITLNARLEPNFYEKSISGDVRFDFDVKSMIDTIRIDAKKMQISNVLLNGKVVNFKNNDKNLLLFEGYTTGRNQLTFTYKAKPKQTLYFNELKSGSYDGLSSSDLQDFKYKNYQIWTQGQGKYTSYWLPSFDDVNEKVIFNLTISAEPFFEVIANGVLIKKEQLGIKANKTWEFKMNKPMSSYLVMLAIGDFYFKKNTSKSGIPLHLYYQFEDVNKLEWTYKYSKEIFDFLESEIDFKYPWKIYKQVPIRDFLYAGMENTTATLFSQDFVVDQIGFNDQNYINVNAHELAHHWFGDLITAKEGKHHWLQEGFATYYALLAEKHLFGDNHFQYELLKNAEEIQKAAKYDTIPILNEKASSLTFYKKGAWALHYLREAIGAKKFQKAIKNYLNKFQYSSVDTETFLAEIKAVAPSFDIVSFKKNWLESKTFDTQSAIALMSQNKVMKQYFELQKMQNLSFENKRGLFLNILKSNSYYILSQEVIYQLMDVPFEQKRELLQIALKTNNLKIRQAIAESTKKIPSEFKAEYETLLKDQSYITREVVLQQLCYHFPEDKKKYLDIASEWVGNNDRSLRITWLGIAVLSKNYQPEKQTAFYNELVAYTTADFESSVRKNALEMLLQINPTDEKMLASLVNATLHHKWQFASFAKNTIRGMLKKEKFKQVFTDLLPKLNEREQHFLRGEIK